MPTLRPRTGLMTKFGLCRICLREAAQKGISPA